MVEIKDFLEKVVYIDGISADNPILVTEMTTVAINPTTILPSSSKISGRGPKDASGISSVPESANAKNKIPESFTQFQARSQKQALNRPFYRKKYFFVVFGVVLLLIVVAGALGVYLLIFSQKSLRDSTPVDLKTTSGVKATTTMNIKSRTITRTPFPTATVTTLIKNDVLLKQVNGITLDQEDNVYVTVPYTALNYPVIYRVNQGNNATLSLLANFSTDGQGLYFEEQGICYFNRALYVPRMGQITKIDLDNGNLITRFAGSGKRGTGQDGQNFTAVFNGALYCVIDNDGNIYVSEESGSIRKVDQSGLVSTVTLAPSRPYGLALNGSSNLLFTTWGPEVVTNFNIQSHLTTKILGGIGQLPRDGPALQVNLAQPVGLALDELGNLYVTERNAEIICKMNTTNYYSKFTGTIFQQGYQDGVGFNSQFNEPRQIVFDSKGRLIVTDQSNSAIRMINW